MESPVAKPETGSEADKPKPADTGNANVSNSHTTISTGFSGVLKIAAKHFPLILGIYMMGYFNMSMAWIFGAVGLTAVREQWRKERDFKMSAARAAAFFDEKDIIKARVVDLPSWVFFPDFERTEWINKILKQLWPQVGHYVRDVIIANVEASIRESLKAYKINGFKFDKISLGTIPPRIGGVKVYDRNVSRTEIIMDMEINYAGDCDLRFNVKGVRAGLKDFQISGMLRVIMKPLIPQIPLVGGLQIFFLNNPSVDFNLIGVADVLDMPGLSDILRRIIVEQIGAILVLPNKLPIQLAADVAPVQLKMPTPAGVLRVRVVEAKHLMKMDVGMLGMGKSDPYCIVTVGAQEFRTKTINNTVNPKWDFYCEAKVESLRSQILFLQVWDYDQGFPGVMNDDYLGRATVDIQSVVKAGKKDMWVTLEDVKTGMVHLELTWFSLTSDPTWLKTHVAETQSLGLSSAVLIVYVDSAKFLPSARSTSKPDPYVVITAGNRSHQTAVRQKTLDPVWEQAFTFLICNPESDDLYFKIMDQKTGSELGMKKITLVSMLTQPGMEMSQQPLTLKNSGPESKLLVSVQLKVMEQGVAQEDEPSFPLVKDAPKPNVPKTAEKIKEPAKEAPKAAPAVPAANGETAKPTPPPVEKTENPEKTLLSSTTSTASTATLNEDKEKVIAHTGAMDEVIASIVNPVLGASHLLEREGSLRRRRNHVSCGQVQLTLRYAAPRQKFVVVVHQAKDLPGAQDLDLPDPYIKLYLLPDRSTSGKRKTDVVKDNVNPVYDETFEFLITSTELPSRELEVMVTNRKQGLFARSPLMGQTKINLGEFNWNQTVTEWFDLAPEGF